AIPCQAPRRSRMRWLAIDRALTRGANGACTSNGATLSGLPSTIRMSRPLCSRARARVLTTIPAPTMIRSARIFVAWLSEASRAHTHCLPGEPALGRWQQVKPEQAQVAPGSQQRLGIAEQTCHLVGETDCHLLIELLSLPVTLQRGEIAQAGLAADQHFSQRQGIAQRQVVTLAGNGVQAMRGVAQYRRMRPPLLLRLDQAQRIEVPCTNLLQGAQAIAEGLLQFAEKLCLADMQQTLGIGVAARPDQRATIVTQRQHGHRAIIGEAFEGLTAMRLQRADVGNQRALPIGLAADVDA